MKNSKFDKNIPKNIIEQIEKLPNTVKIINQYLLEIALHTEDNTILSQLYFLKWIENIKSIPDTKNLLIVASTICCIECGSKRNIYDNTNICLKKHIYNYKELKIIPPSIKSTTHSYKSWKNQPITIENHIKKEKNYIKNNKKKVELFQYIKCFNCNSIATIPIDLHLKNNTDTATTANNKNINIKRANILRKQQPNDVELKKIFTKLHR